LIEFGPFLERVISIRFKGKSDFSRVEVKKYSIFLDILDKILHLVSFAPVALLYKLLYYCSYLVCRVLI
jgi:hypothetical protein